MALPILTTKLYVPPVRSDLVSRPRLVELLNESTHSSKLTLISAPAGFGKTTLISEWVNTCRPLVAWLSLDKSDNDLARFWTYVVAALQTIPDLLEADASTGLLHMLQPSQTPPVEALLTGLINETTNSTRRSVLVLDDLHVITEPRVHEGIAFLLDHLPPAPHGLHLVVASRMDPPWSLARLRVRGELTELRAPDLRFTLQEVSRFFDNVVQLELSPRDLAALDRRTEGWVAGLQMAALSMRGRRQTPGE